MFAFSLAERCSVCSAFSPPCAIDISPIVSLSEPVHLKCFLPHTRTVSQEIFFCWFNGCNEVSEECCEQECLHGAKGLTERLGRHDAMRDGGDRPCLLVAMDCYSYLAELLIFVLISCALILHLVEVEKFMTQLLCNSK